MVNSAVNLNSNGLGTLTYVIPAAGTYAFDGKIHVPTAVENAGTAGNLGGVSAVVVTISQNGTQRYAGMAGAQGFQLYQLPCAANDSITIVTSSAAAVDQGLNAVKLTMAIY